MAQTLDLDQLSANVAEVVQRVLPYDLFALLLYNEKRRDLRIRYALGHREEVIRNLTVKLGEGVTGAAAGNGSRCWWATCVAIRDTSIQSTRCVRSLPSQ